MEFETPQAEDLKTTNGKPWTLKLEYKSGKVPQAFALKTSPEEVGAGFYFYRPETKEKGNISRFKCAIIGVYSGVGGAVPRGSRFDNYWSNFVKDTRTDIVKVQLGSGENSVTIAEGLYSDIKKDLPDGVSYKKFAAVYVFNTREVAALELTMSLETALKECIGDLLARKPEQVNLFNLFELSTRFWGFGFAGEFTMRQRDGKAYDGKGEMYYYPVLSCGIVTAEKYPELPELAASAGAYIDAYQDRLKNGKPSNQASSAPKALPLPEPTSHMDTAKSLVQEAGFAPDPTFPTEGVTSHNEVGGDDLPF